MTRNQHGEAHVERTNIPLTEELGKGGAGRVPVPADTEAA